MKKFILGLIVLSSLVYATDYTSLSTEDLVALRGTVPVEDRDVFKSEMQSRASTLTYDEKVALGIPRQQSTTASASGYGQKLRDGSGAGGMYKGSNSGGKGRR